MRAAALILLLTLAGCAGPEAVHQDYAAMGGVQRLYELPTDKTTYKRIGLESWSFPRTWGWQEPSATAVWPQISEKVRALGGNVCIVRTERMDLILTRSLAVTCEILKVKS